MHAILNRFEGTLLGDVKHFLGMDIFHDRQHLTISINQTQMTKGLAHRSGLGSHCGRHPLVAGTHLPPLTADEAALYPSVVGALMHISTVFRPDVSFAASQLARHLAAPTAELLTAAQRENDSTCM